MTDKDFNEAKRLLSTIEDNPQMTDVSVLKTAVVLLLKDMIERGQITE